MKKIFGLFVGSCLAMSVINAQNYFITFEGTGEASTIDLITVSNPQQGISITLAGTDVLNLISETVGIDDKLSRGENQLFVYPNPVKDQSSVIMTNVFDSPVIIEIFDIKGNQLAKCERYLSGGQHEFKIAGLSAGLYFVRGNAGGRLSQCKIISLNSGKEKTSLTYMGQNNRVTTTGIVSLKDNHREHKGNKGTVQMNYGDGEMLIIKASSGVHSTVRTIVPSSDLTVQCVFVSCVDFDNISYSTVKIGDQTWMAENLRSTHASNGNLIVGGLFDYSNDPANSLIYGKLYRWSAIMAGAPSSTSVPSGVKGICPDDWHLPSKGELDNLVAELGPSSAAGGKLKEAGTSHWITPNTGANNSSGFSFLPSGSIGEVANTFGGLGTKGYLWSSTENFANNGWALQLTNTAANSTVKALAKTFGFSCRCVKD